MSADFGILLPLWCYDKDATGLLDRAAGEIGLGHVTCPVVGGPLIETLVSGVGVTPHFETEGGWHYPPEPKAYADFDLGHLKPRAARWVGGRWALATLREDLAQRGVRLVVRVDLRAVHVLAEHQPHLAIRSAWGDQMAAAGMCPAQPQVRELLLATLEDLRRFEPLGVELVDWTLDTPANVGASSVRCLSSDLANAVETCFCTACRAIAGARGCDADLAARAVKLSMDAFVRDPQAVAGEQNAALAQYRGCRAEEMTRWLAALADRFADWRRFLVSARNESSAAPGWRRLGDARVQPAASRGRVQTGVDAVILPAWRPQVASAADLVRWTAELHETGVTHFDFDGLHAAAPEAISWVRQAVRYARRG
ncbi:MAG: hypothetical protein U1D55_03090 [Phycisphaerae bacterium]